MNPEQANPTVNAGPDDLSSVIEQVDTHIESFLAVQALPENLYQAIVYSVLGGGKRLRPALAWYCNVAFGGDGNSSLPAGTAVELIHAFSLIHDDLPALDNDELRRGRPTLHIHAGEPMAILAGDALLSLAYESVLKTDEPTQVTNLISELALGTRLMIAGQVYDTLGGLPAGISEEDAVELIHRNKTGALLRASCRMGAITAGASQEQMELITIYAESIGLQFQIVDDLLDVEGDAHAVGKATGKDASAGKRTYPGILGVEGSKRLAQSLEQTADAALGRLESCSFGNLTPLRQLGRMLTSRRS